ncbi:MAG: acyl-CoA dehydrogenase family protein [Actinomycetota bacterium]
MSRQGVPTERVDELLATPGDVAVTPLLPAMAANAEHADRTRTIADEVIGPLKASPVVRMAASPSLGGEGATVTQIGRELEAVAAACTSTAWVLWNHLSVFHLFVGCLGPGHADWLRSQVEAGETVCFPAGAGSGVQGVVADGVARLNGKGSFGTGGRYADWAGVAFVVVDADGRRAEPLDIRFTVVDLRGPGVKIDPNWDGSGVRASATDDIHYTDVVVDLDRCVEWYGANRAESLRHVPVVDHRYREDWVGLSDLWLAWMGVGLVRTALGEVVDEFVDRKSILGRKMVTHPTVQLNLGAAASLVSAAAATAGAACREVDERIAAEQAPTEADYLRQMAQSSGALRQLEEAMDLLRRSQGGNGLRESKTFERRWRDFQAMPLHINAHQDRVDLRLGRHLLGEDQDPF